MHHGGEVDLRGTYCAMSVATLLNIVDSDLIGNAPDFVAKCQTYEGGYSCVPFDEAHGGYTFCASAAMVLMKSVPKINLPRLRRWSVNRQSTLMGGFNGRTNKLIDACYSFWVGALFPILDAIPAIITLTEGSPLAPAQTASLLRIHAVPWEGLLPPPTPIETPLADFGALAEYVLMACQDRNAGGLKDKPSCNADHYHTCYAMSGLAIAAELTQHTTVALNRINPLFNVCHERVSKMLFQFGGRRSI
jgi:protein farnesyltransferase subunit beta